MAQVIQQPNRFGDKVSANSQLIMQALLKKFLAGKELEKAYLALKYDLEYVQDEELEIN